MQQFMDYPESCGEAWEEKGGTTALQFYGHGNSLKGVPMSIYDGVAHVKHAESRP